MSLAQKYALESANEKIEELTKNIADLEETNRQLESEKEEAEAKRDDMESELNARKDTSSIPDELVTLYNKWYQYKIQKELEKVCKKPIPEEVIKLSESFLEDIERILAKYE